MMDLLTGCDTASEPDLAGIAAALTMPTRTSSNRAETMLRPTLGQDVETRMMFSDRVQLG
jgi:hypothetical protein